MELVPEHPDRLVAVRRVVAGVLQRMPGGLQEQPVLRVKHPGGLRSETEEVGVELLDPGQQCGPADIGAVGQGLLPTPASIRSSSDRSTMDSTPSRRLRQNSDNDAAPGNRPAMPTTAIAFGGGGVSSSQCWGSRSLSHLPARGGLLAGGGALLCTISNDIRAFGGGGLGQAQLADQIHGEVGQGGALQDEGHRWFHPKSARTVLRIRTAISESIPSSVSG